MAGIAILLLITLFLFIKSKQEKRVNNLLS
ncbi:hypothetical protein GQR36_15935 [Enterococcus termitis]